MNTTTNNNNTTEQTQLDDPQPPMLTIRVPGKKHRPYRPRRDPATMNPALAWYYRNREENLEKREKKRHENKREPTEEERTKRREYQREYQRRRKAEEKEIGNAKGTTLNELSRRMYRKKHPPKIGRTVIVGDEITLEDACRYALINLGLNIKKREKTKEYYREYYRKHKETKNEEPTFYEI